MSKTLTFRLSYREDDYVEWEADKDVLIPLDTFLRQRNVSELVDRFIEEQVEDVRRTFQRLVYCDIDMPNHFVQYDARVRVRLAYGVRLPESERDALLEETYEVPVPDEIEVVE